MEKSFATWSAAIPNIWSLMSDCIPSHAQTVICFESHETTLPIWEVLETEEEKKERNAGQSCRSTTPWTTECYLPDSGRGEMFVGSG